MTKIDCCLPFTKCSSNFDKIRRRIYLQMFIQWLWFFLNYDPIATLYLGASMIFCSYAPYLLCYLFKFVYVHKRSTSSTCDFHGNQSKEGHSFYGLSWNRTYARAGETVRYYYSKEQLGKLCMCLLGHRVCHTRVGTLIMATIYLQLIQNRYMFRSFTVLQCSHQHCVQPVASDVEVVGYL